MLCNRYNNSVALIFPGPLNILFEQRRFQPLVSNVRKLKSQKVRSFEIGHKIFNLHSQWTLSEKILGDQTHDYILIEIT
jgi:hypothetical protein